MHNAIVIWEWWRFALTQPQPNTLTGGGPARHPSWKTARPIRPKFITHLKKGSGGRFWCFFGVYVVFSGEQAGRNIRSLRRETTRLHDQPPWGLVGTRYRGLTPVGVGGK